MISGRTCGIGEEKNPVWVVTGWPTIAQETGLAGGFNECAIERDSRPCDTTILTGDHGPSLFSMVGPHVEHERAVGQFDDCRFIGVGTVRPTQLPVVSTIITKQHMAAIGRGIGLNTGNGMIGRNDESSLVSSLS